MIQKCVVLPAVKLSQQTVNIGRSVAASVCHKQADQLWWDVVPDWVGHLKAGFKSRPLRIPAGLDICEGCYIYDV